MSHFIKSKIYALQTVVTNTSVATLDLQLLVDIPQGSLPISSAEYTKIVSEVVGSYSVKTFTHLFYFPNEGKFRVYPANAAKNGVVISKAEKMQPIEVLAKYPETKLETFSDVLRSGTQKDILLFVK